MAVTGPPRVSRLVGVYNADGSLLGELRYVVGRAFGSVHCELCDITHGRVRKKRAFVALERTLPVPLELLHRDEQPDELAAATRGALPCVVAQTSSGYRIVLTAEQLASCNGDAGIFDAILRRALHANGVAVEQAPDL